MRAWTRWEGDERCVHGQGGRASESSTLQSDRRPTDRQVLSVLMTD